MTVVRQADIGKVLADEIYAPMFVQVRLDGSLTRIDDGHRRG